MLSVVQERTPKPPTPASQHADSTTQADPQTLELAAQRAGLISNSLSIEGFTPRSSRPVLREPQPSTSSTTSTGDAPSGCTPSLSTSTSSASASTSARAASAADAARPKQVFYASATSGYSEAGSRSLGPSRARGFSGAPAELRSSLKHSHSLNARSDVEWLDAAGCPIAPEGGPEDKGAAGSGERRVTFWSADMVSQPCAHV